MNTMNNAPGVNQPPIYPMNTAPQKTSNGCWTDVLKVGCGFLVGVAVTILVLLILGIGSGRSAYNLKTIDYESMYDDIDDNNEIRYFDVKSKNGEAKIVQLTPRGKLHADTFYGSIKQYDSDSQSIQYIYTKRVVVDENLNVNNVVNERVKEILKKRLEQNNGEAKKAFSNLDENPIWFNEEKGICIKRVVVKATDVKDPIPLHKKRDRKGNVVSNQKNTDFVKPDNNHHAAIYVNAKGELKEDVVTFYDAVRRANRHLPVIDKNAFVKDGWSFLYSIQKNEFFIFPDVESGFNPLEIDLMKQDNFALISPHLYKVQKISSLNYLLRVHTDTSSKTPNELKDITWKSLRSLKGFIGSVKVKINHLGRIYDIEKIQLPG